jgi:hypothetical protein
VQQVSMPLHLPADCGTCSITTTYSRIPSSSSGSEASPSHSNP